MQAGRWDALGPTTGKGAQALSAPWSRRRGLSSVTLVLGLLVVIAALGWYQQAFTRQTLSQVHRTQLAFLARLQARSAIQELRAVAADALNRPGTALFRSLRKVLDEPWTKIDLTHHLPPPELVLEPRWGRADTRPASGGATGRLLEVSVVLRAGRSHVDPAATEEAAGVLTFRVAAEMADAVGRVRREVTESYELRALLATAPRPFDQADLFLGHLGALVDVGRVGALRERFIDAQAALREQIQRTLDIASLPPDLDDRFRAIRDGMLPREALEERVPEVTGEAALLGFHHVEEGRLEGLALLAALEAHERRVAALEEELRAADRDPFRRVDVVYRLASELSNAHDTSWAFQHSMRVMPWDSPGYQAGIAPYLERLTPGYFLDRAHLVFPEDEPGFRHWLRGRATLQGVVDLTSWEGAVPLRGDLQGRVVLLVGPGGAEVDSLNARMPTHLGRITIVSLGGDVRIRGRSRAAVLMLHRPGNRFSAGRLTVDPGATLIGQVIVPDPSPTRLAVRGALVPDPELRASFPPSDTLERAGSGEYVLTLSPEPLFTEGRSL